MNPTCHITDGVRWWIAITCALACWTSFGCSDRAPGEPAAQASPTPAPDTTSRSGDPTDGSSKTPDNMRVRPRMTRRAGGVLDLTFDDLEFEIERDGNFQRDLLGEQIESYKGRPIVLRGFILGASVFQQQGIKQFVLVRDNQECCFGPGAYIFHNAQVEMAPGKSCDFSIRPVTVEGTFDIRPFLGPGGKCYSVYHITADRVK